MMGCISNQGFHFHHYKENVSRICREPRKNSAKLTLSEFNSSHLPESHPKKDF